MAVIEKFIHLVGSKGGKELQALFESGSTYPCIQPTLAKRLGRLEALPEPMEFGTAKKKEIRRW